MKKKIAVLAGDGIGPEIMSEAIKVLRSIEECYGHTFTFQEAYVGGAAWEHYGNHFPSETRQTCEQSDAILFGAVGGPVHEQGSPKWKDCERNSILQIRQHFRFQINLRPAKVYPALESSCVLRPHIIQDGVDILCVRELLEDIYFGEHRIEAYESGRQAVDVMSYSEPVITDIAHAAFKAARSRKKGGLCRQSQCAGMQPSLEGCGDKDQQRLSRLPARTYPGGQLCHAAHPRPVGF